MAMSAGGHSRGRQPDLAGDGYVWVLAQTLRIVGSLDTQVTTGMLLRNGGHLNRTGYLRRQCRPLRLRSHCYAWYHVLRPAGDRRPAIAFIYLITLPTQPLHFLLAVELCGIVPCYLFTPAPARRHRVHQCRPRLSPRCASAPPDSRSLHYRQYLSASCGTL